MPADAIGQSIHFFIQTLQIINAGFLLVIVYFTLVYCIKGAESFKVNSKNWTNIVVVDAVLVNELTNIC